MACLAVACTTMHIRILWCVLVPTRTMSFLCILRHCRVTAQVVYLVRHRFKVCRIDTSLVFAQVIDGESIRDWPYEVLISNAMNKPRSSCNPHNSIASASLRSMPFPASTGKHSNLCPKSIEWGILHFTCHNYTCLPATNRVASSSVRMPASIASFTALIASLSSWQGQSGSPQKGVSLVWTISPSSH